MGANRAVIYSNGIADFRRSYDVEGSLRMAIPVKQDHVADVLASLHVLGDVSLSSPPTFRPANEAVGSLTLDPDNILTGLARSLGGAEVEVRRAGGDTLRGTLAGLHTHDEASAGDAVQVRSLVVLSEGSLMRVPVNEVDGLVFQDAVVQAELEKALQRQVQQIKPNSTFVELELSSEASTEALVQYTVPAAAWKISYRLRALDETTFELQGYAIVDNNTDEDWRDFHLAVVTGEPITFSTDLADSKAPQRRHVNIVREEALGAVEPEMAMAMLEAVGEPESRVARRRKAASKGVTRGGAMMEQMADDGPDMRMMSARTSAATVEESGDFCIYRAETPVSIDSNRSAVIPVFSVTMDRARSVLHFKEANHATRPYRSIQFVNETSHSLGRGVCTVFEAGVYGGSCIMPATKPDGEALLPHALETGVLMRVEHPRQRTRQTGLRISKGVCHRQQHARQETRYRAASSRDETCQLVIDHQHTLPDAELSVQVTREETTDLSVEETLTDGVRLRIELPARATLLVAVVETTVTWSEHVLAGDDGSCDMIWLARNVMRSNGPLAGDEALAACVEIQAELDAKKAEIEKTEQEVGRLTKRQERLRQNVGAGAKAQQSAQWLADLGKAEDRIVELEDKRLPALAVERDEIQQRLHAALRAVDAEWST